MISKDKLILEIKNIFPRIRKPEDYANLIFTGYNLKAYDHATSRKRHDFTTQKIKDHVINRSYNVLNLLVPVKNASKILTVSSERQGLVYVKTQQHKIVEYEQKLLFKHIVIDHHVRFIAVKSLRLPATSNIDGVKRKMMQGNIFEQVSVYDKVLSELGKNGVKRKEYMGLRVVSTPIDHYYLSSKSKDIIEKSKGGEK